jgi:hypothetical protein
VRTVWSCREVKTYSCLPRERAFVNCSKNNCPLPPPLPVRATMRACHVTVPSKHQRPQPYFLVVHTSSPDIDPRSSFPRRWPSPFHHRRRSRLRLSMCISRPFSPLCSACSPFAAHLLLLAFLPFVPPPVQFSFQWPTVYIPSAAAPNRHISYISQSPLLCSSVMLFWCCVEVQCNYFIA